MWWWQLWRRWWRWWWRWQKTLLLLTISLPSSIPLPVILMNMKIMLSFLTSHEESRWWKWYDKRQEFHDKSAIIDRVPQHSSLTWTTSDGYATLEDYTLREEMKYRYAGLEMLAVKCESSWSFITVSLYSRRWLLLKALNSLAQRLSTIC